MQAQLEAIRFVARETTLFPVGMSIGPYSLTTKLLADPITPTYLAGSGVTGAEEPDVALLEAAARIAFTTVRHSVAQQLAAGARAIFIAEPAANLVFFSPLQLEAGSDIFERLVLGPNRAIAALVAEFGADLLFHCCGELVDPMLDGFCSLHPTLLSLGSSRRLWEDAARVPKDIVLYGNLPSKQFYSDGLMPPDRVETLTLELAERMRATGHPFILGTECDTLCVDGAAETIRAKLARMLTAELVPQRN
jgi:uroporphyrinogen-III decarboxylase